MVLFNRCRWVVPIAFALVAATGIAACGDDSGEDDQPASSPSASATTLEAGELIAFDQVVPGSEERDLYAVGPDGGEPTLLHSPGGYPHWSPDGSKLAFLGCLNPPDCTTGLALLDRSTGEVQWFPMPDPDLFTACAVWVPSGKEVACGGLSEGDPTRNGVYTVRASDGKGLTRVTRNPGGEDGPLTYSPDGGQLLIVRVDPSRSEPANHALFVAPLGGGQPQRITPWGISDDYASWSPDGSTIVFGSEGSLYRVSPDGQGLAEIDLKMADGSSPESAFDVAFSPDGQTIVFSLGGPEPGLYTARPDGSDVQQLTSSPTEDHHANWGAAPGS